MLLRILNISGKKYIYNDRITKNEGVISPKYTTRSNQGIEEKWGGRSIVYKTIVKQGIEGSLVYCANGPITIWKLDSEGGMATCVQKWKTYKIFKRKSAGRLHAEKKQQDCGAPSPPGECWSFLNPPILSTDNKVTGATTNILRKENRKKCYNFQE